MSSIIDFPENVNNFAGVKEHIINSQKGPLIFKQNNEIEFKIKLKYLLAYQEHLINNIKHCKLVSNDIYEFPLDEILDSYPILLDLFEPIKSNNVTK